MKFQDVACSCRDGGLPGVQPHGDGLRVIICYAGVLWLQYVAGL